MPYTIYHDPCVYCGPKPVGTSPEALVGHPPAVGHQPWLRRIPSRLLLGHVPLTHVAHLSSILGTKVIIICVFWRSLLWVLWTSLFWLLRSPTWLKQVHDVLPCNWQETFLSRKPNFRTSKTSKLEMRTPKPPYQGASASVRMYRNTNIDIYIYTYLYTHTPPPKTKHVNNKHEYEQMNTYIYIHIHTHTCIYVYIGS